MDLNFASLEFNSNNYVLYRLEYIDTEQLQSLRKSYNTTNSFFRHGNYIYHSPMLVVGAFYEGTKEEFSIINDIEITKKLIKHIVFRIILANKAIVTEFDPVEFFRIDDKRFDLLSSNLEKNESSKVGYWKGFTIDTRVITNNNNYPLYGFILNDFHTWKIKINCKTLLSMGIELTGKYVEIYDKERGDIFKTNRKLVGKVLNYDEDYAKIIKNETEEKYLLTELYLENSVENREAILINFLGEKKAKENFQKLFDTTQERAGAKGKWDAIYKLREWLKIQTFTNNHGFNFKVGEFVKNIDSQWQSINITKPLFIFNVQNSQKDIWHDRGLKEYGPYSKSFSKPKNIPTIAFIFREVNRGIVSQFMGKLRDGLPDIVNKGYAPYGQGFTSKYRLSNITTKLYSVVDEKIESYEKAVRQLIEEIGEDVDLVIIESCQDYKSLPHAENPYFFTKAQLLKHGIPSQVVLFENMDLKDKRLVYILNNMSLAMYAKIGGIPWVIPSEPNVDHELVIGIGNKVFKENRFNFSRRIVGITTLFTGDGNYLLSNASKDVPYEAYLEELKRTLEINISKVKLKYNWRTGDTIRLVFHVFKPFNNEEILAIEDMVADLKKEYTILFAYVNIIQNHPFLIFDKNQEGVFDNENYGKFKGIWQPARMINTKIDRYNHLLQLTGPNEIKTFKQGMASPVIVKLHEKSSFTDLDYLTRQVYLFSSISWRGFQPSSLPVTLEYSNQIAEILGNLRQSGYWDNDLLPSSLNFKTWFL